MLQAYTAALGRLQKAADNGMKRKIPPKYPFGNELHMSSS